MYLHSKVQLVVRIYFIEFYYSNTSRTFNLNFYLFFLQQDRRKLLVKDAGTPALQVFEEDTRMSSDSLFTSPSIRYIHRFKLFEFDFIRFSSFRRTTEFLQNEESQSSLHSSTSATVESSVKKFRSKIEVVDPEG